MHCRWWQWSFNLVSVEEISTAPFLVSIRWILYCSWWWVPFYSLKAASVQSKSALVWVKNAINSHSFGWVIFQISRIFTVPQDFHWVAKAGRSSPPGNPLLPTSVTCPLFNVHSIGIQYSQMKTRVCHSGMGSVVCCTIQRHETQGKIHASTNKKFPDFFNH